MCRKCKIIKKDDYYHCGPCGVCVEGIDHHCIFYAKCIARGNTGSFYAAICSMVLLICYMCTSIIYENLLSHWILTI